MSEATTSNRREKRKASGKGASLLIDLEGDFLDIEKNFKPDSHSPLINEASSISNWPKEDSEVGQKQVKSGLKVGQTEDHKVGQKQVKSELKVGQENQLNSEHKHESRLKVEQKQVISGLKVGLEVGQQVGQSLPSSSSFNITTTNYKADALAKIELTETLTSIGFNQGHIEQLLRDSSLTPEEIQNSLNAFAFDLGFEDVKRKVRSPIGLIMKLLKNGQVYISEKGYESEEDRLYRELIERADKKNEEKKNLKAKFFEVKFEEWLENISDDDKRNMAEAIGEFMGLLHRQELKEYFKREVYE